MSTTLLYRAFSLNGYHYVSQHFQEGQVIFRIENPKERLRCSHCGSAQVWGHGGDDKPLTSEQAAGMVGKRVTVQMKVHATKDRLEKRGEIYLDSEEDFRDPKNFAVVITKAGAAKLKEKGIAKPAEHFRGKTIQATGEVKVVDDVPRIEINEADRIRIVTDTPVR